MSHNRECTKSENYNWSIEYSKAPPCKECVYYSEYMCNRHLTVLAFHARRDNVNCGPNGKFFKRRSVDEV